MREQRYEKILAILADRKMHSINEVHELTRAPISTLRKDFNDMAAAGLIVRFHGGAMLAGEEAHKADEELPFKARGISNASEKRRIAEHAMRYVYSGCTILMDGGTTTNEAARLLKNYSQPVTVVTNNLSAALTMADNPNINLLILGGIVRSSHYSIVGSFTEQMLSLVRADLAFCSCDAINAEGDLLTFNAEDVLIKKAIRENAQKKILLVDHTKFNASAYLKVGHVTELDTLIVGSELESDRLTRLQELEVNVELA